MKDLKDCQPISRRVLINLDNRIAPRPQDYVTVTLYPSGVISFRANRARNEVSLTLSHVYALAIRKDMEDNKATRRKKASRGLLKTFGVK